MTFENTTFKEYFCLKNRDSLSLDPWLDGEQFFGRQELGERVAKRIESDFVKTRTIPKFFVHGSYGSGKTHTLAHIKFILSHSELYPYPTEPIYIDIAPLAAKERYAQIHARLLDAIGMDRVKAAAEGTADTIKGDKVEGFLSPSVMPFGDQTLRTSEANIFRNLLFGGRQAQMSWEWLKGRKLSDADAHSLGTQKQLTDAQDLVFCLLNVGALYKIGCKKRLVFLIDEAEAFRVVTAPDSQNELRHALRQLLENVNTFIGFIFAIQVESGQEGVGDFFSAEDIRRRVDYDSGYIDLNGLVSTVDDARTFITEMLAYLIDQNRAEELIRSEALDTTKASFPFTEEAIDSLCQHIADFAEGALPARIISWMSDAAIEAWRRRTKAKVHQLVTREILEETIFPDH